MDRDNERYECQNCSEKFAKKDMITLKKSQTRLCRPCAQYNSYRVGVLVDEFIADMSDEDIIKNIQKNGSIERF
jgi:hypothetical protein